jgi:release factor glutamine methyltransferase
VTSIREAVRAAAGRLREVGIVPGDPDAVALAAKALGVSAAEVRKAMILGGEMPSGYDRLVEQRLARVPLQHITGTAGFRGLELSVGPGVFVPRPETEMVAGLAIDEARRVSDPARGDDLDTPWVVDLCSGSGAIALAVAAEVPHARVVAVELDPMAVAWAQRNVHDLASSVELVEADATTALPGLDGQVAVVVSNPPYIPVGMVPLDPEVRDHDPELALYGGSEDGLRIPLAVARRAAQLLRPGGLLVMEHADTQGQSLPHALGRTGEWTDIADHDDLTGRPRATTARRAARA